MANPYTGPRPFERADRRNFFGRSREVEELLDLLMAERVVLLYSPSGAGKSSLLAAGLIPRLEEEHFRVLPVMRVSRRPPPEWGPAVAAANRYVLSLLLCLEDGLPADTPRLGPAQLAGLRLAEYLKQRYDFDDPTESHVLVFDQFEEILTLRPADQLGTPASMSPADRERLFDADREAKQDFFVQVGAALRNRHRWALFALREDYVAGLDPHLAAVPTRLANTYRLNLLDRVEALDAVRKPAAGEGVEFTAAAAEKLVDDLRLMRVPGPVGLVQVPGPYVEPVQLQVVCLLLWERLRPEPGGTIHVADLDVLGDVDSALMGYYDRKVEEVAAARGVRQREVRDWFDRYLITVQGRRGQVLQGDPSQTVPDEVVADLVNAHLVREDKRAGATWFELSHDRLVAPVRKSNDAWNQLHLSPLQRMASIWDSKGRPAANFLLRHQELADGEAWAKKHAAEMNDVDRAFLQACRDYQARRDGEKSRQRLTTVLLASAIGGVVAVIVIIALSVFAARLKESKEAAEANKKVADANAQDALTHQAVAERREQVIQAEQLARFARDKATSNPEFGLFLGLKALDLLDAKSPEGGADTTDRANVELARMAVRSALNACAPALRAQRTLLRHDEPVNDVVYSPDGKWLATASDDGTARLWDADGKPLRTLDSHPGAPVNALAFRPDGSALATASEDGLVRVWRLAEGTHEPEVETFNLESPVRAVAFSRKGKKLLAAGTESGVVAVWEVTSRRLVHRFRHDNKVNAIAFNPAIPNRLVSASDDGTVRVWQPEDEGASAPRRVLPHGFPVTALAFKADGKVLATVSEDSAIRLWYGEAGQVRSMLLGHAVGITGSVRVVAFHPDGHQLVTGNGDMRVNVWDVNGVVPLHSYSGHKNRITAVTFRPHHNDQLATSSDDGTVKVWDLKPRVQALLQAGAGPQGSQLYSVSFSADGKSVAAGGSDGWAKVWDTRSGRETVNATTGHRQTVRSVAFRADGKQVVTGSDDATARVWDADTGRELVTLTGHTRGVWGVAYSPDGKEVATASQDGTARVWDARSGQQLCSLDYSPRRWPVTVAYSRDGKRLATGGTDGIVHIWDREPGQESYWQESQPLPGQEGTTVYSVAFSRDGTRLIAGNSGGAACVWDVAGKQPRVLHTLAVPRPDQAGRPAPTAAPATGRAPTPAPYVNPVYGVAYSPDGRWVATGGGDGTIRVWDADSGELRYTLSGHKLPIWSVAFSPDGRRLASASWDRTARVWDVDGEEAPVVLTGHAALYGVAFGGPGGGLLATGGDDGATRLWSVADGTPVRALAGETGVVRAVAVSPDGKTFAASRSSASSTTVWLLDAAHSHAPRELLFPLEGLWLPTPTYLGALGTLWPWPGQATVGSLAFSPTGTRVAGALDRSAKVWDTRTGRLLAACWGEHGHTRLVSAVAFSPGGDRLATGGTDYRVKLWDAETGRFLFDLGGAKDRHGNTVYALAFSPDGKYLATGSLDRTVKIWDISSGEAASKAPRTLTGCDGAVYGLAFSPNGECLGAVVQNGTVRVWDVALSKEVLYLGAGSAYGYVTGHVLAFTDNNHLLVVDASHSVREFLLDLHALRDLAEKHVSDHPLRQEMEKELQGILKGD
jgi:WD40 repeat protein